MGVWNNAAWDRALTVAWAEELLPAAIAAGVTQLLRLNTAASACINVGRPEDGVGYAHAAVRLQDDPGYQVSHLRTAGGRQEIDLILEFDGSGRPGQFVERAGSDLRFGGRGTNALVRATYSP